MKYYRAGNTGIIDGVPGVNGLVEFTMGKSFVPSSLLLWGNGARGIPKMKVAGHDIVPWGPHNDMPEAVCHLLHRFYAAEGILSKITGLQWGQGPHLYEDDIDLVELGSFLDAWTQLFSGGLSFIEQLPIGDYFRIGFEQYICRNFWLNFSNFGEQEDFGNVEIGLGAYVSFRTGQHRISLDAHYGLLDFNTHKPRLSLALTYSNVIVYESASSIK